MASLPPGQVHSRQVLFEAGEVRVADFRCTAPVEPAGAEEPNPADTIVFVRRGLFQRTHRHEAVLADPGTVLFFNRGEAYRYAHPLPGGDACTILELAPSLAREVVARHAPADAERRDGPFRYGGAPASARVLSLQYELLASVAQRPPAIAVDDLLAEIADESLRGAYHLRGGQERREPCDHTTRRRHAELAEAARLALNARLAAPPSLAELARALGCSPFHLSRTFHRVAGLPLRRYLRRLRACAAAERIAGGAKDLTRLALELGFADHAHFTNTFREEWGLPPSRFRARLRAGRSRAPCAGASGPPFA